MARQLRHVSYSRYAWRQRRNVSLVRKMRSSWSARTRSRARTYADVCSRGEQLETRATLPRFPSSARFCLFPSRGRSTNPGSSVIPRALVRSRTCLANGDSLIRNMSLAGSPPDRCFATAPLHSCSLCDLYWDISAGCLVSAANAYH